MPLIRVASISQRWQRAFAPWTFFGGVAAGFGALCLLGWRASHENSHADFTRFTQWIAPETQYFPTAEEIANIVRSRASPEKILVVVGGNSVLYGVGQPRDEVWTKYLQQVLGHRYSVVNLALRGSLPSDGGAVIAEILRKEYPRQIYIANPSLNQPLIPDGSNVYRFIFWDAWYKGLLMPDPTRMAAIAASHEIAAYHEGIGELQARMWLDHIFYFQDFWNRFTLLHLNTVWGSYTPGLGSFLQARAKYPDPEADFLSVPESKRFPSYRDEDELTIIRAWDRSAIKHGKIPTRNWVPDTIKWRQFTESINAGFPQALKARTLMLLGRNGPHYYLRLNRDDQERDNLAYHFAVRKWQEGGYECMEFGADFTNDDYGDRVHLTSHGGIKLASLVADKVREMSVKLGYLKP